MIFDFFVSKAGWKDGLVRRKPQGKETEINNGNDQHRQSAHHRIEEADHMLRIAITFNVAVQFACYGRTCTKGQGTASADSGHAHREK